MQFIVYIDLFCESEQADFFMYVHICLVALLSVYLDAILILRNCVINLEFP